MKNSGFDRFGVNQRGVSDPEADAGAAWGVPPRPSLKLEDYFLLAAILLLPWAFGGVEIWAYRSAALLLVAAGAVAIHKRRLPLEREDARLWAPAGLLLLWGLLQLVPVPPVALRVLSPESYRIYQASLPGYPGAMPEDALGAIEASALAAVPEAAAFPPPREPETPLRAHPASRPSRWRPLSTEPSATQERVLWYAALLIGFLVVRQRVAEPDVYRVYRGALFVLFVALAIFALIQALYWNGMLFWIRPVGSAHPFGPYVNPNHFAGVMELAVPWLAGFAWSRAFRAREHPGVAQASILFQGAVVCLAAGLAARSVMGTALLLGGLAILGVLAAPTWRARFVMAGSMLTAGCFGAWLLKGTSLGEDLLSYYQRSQLEGFAGSRAPLWGASLRMWLDFPITGAGFGTYREMIPRYLPPGAKASFAQAHNDYLEVLLSGGIVAGLLLVAMIWGFWSRVPRGLRDVGDEGWSVSRLGLVLGIAALSVHAWVDFNHQIPANALLFVTACALAVPSDGGRREGTESTPARFGKLPLLLVGLLLFIFAGRAVSGALGGVALARARVFEADRSYEQALRLYRKAGVGSIRSRALLDAADTRLDIWDGQVKDRGPAGANRSLLAASASDYLDYLYVSPASWRPWAGLAEVYDRRERVRRELEPGAPSTEPEAPWATVGRSGRIAIGLTRKAIERTPAWFGIYDQLASTFRRYGLRAEARAAVRASAAANPNLGFHRYPDPMPGWMLDAFAEGSWDALGRVPFVSETEHLIELAKIEWMRKDLGRAAGALTSALELPGDANQRAETSYYLGWVLLEAKKYREAKSHLEIAAANPIFAESARSALSRLATETAGKDANP